MWATQISDMLGAGVLMVSLSFLLLWPRIGFVRWPLRRSNGSWASHCGLDALGFLPRPWFPAPMGWPFNRSRLSIIFILFLFPITITSSRGQSMLVPLSIGLIIFPAAYSSGSVLQSHRGPVIFILAVLEVPPVAKGNPFGPTIRRHSDMRQGLVISFPNDG